MQEIDISPLDANRFAPILRPEQSVEFTARLDEAAKRLAGHALWHVNSTATGGGVAEMLHSVLGYLVDGGVDTRWLVVEGDDDFFGVTKRIHHWLHGSRGDGGPLDETERELYMSCLEHQVDELTDRVRPGDVVVLHDPQTLGLAPAIHELGGAIVWSCHIGIDEPNELTRQAWKFLAPYVRFANRVVFSRRQYAWDLLDPAVVEVVPPCIDAFSSKNQWLEVATVDSILETADVIPKFSTAPPTFRRQNGDEAKVSARAQMFEMSPIPADSTVVTQISRWDPLKDHLGVMRGFARAVDSGIEARLVLAGPSPDSIADDPEGRDVLDELRQEWGNLRIEHRRKVHIACLPMDDLEENAAIVNALQRRPAVVVQKSLAEGFGLTVAEAMWKERATLASAVGGINDQIESGVDGILVEDPRDLDSFGSALRELLDDLDRARGLGQRAHESVRGRFLAPQYLSRFLELALAARSAASVG